jgi:hypothetical protein
MGNLLISGNGKGNSAIAFWWVFEIISASACGGLSFYLSNVERGKSSSFWGVQFNTGNITLADYFYYIGIICIFLCIICAIFLHRGIAKSEINVYEKGIIGMGAGKYFLWGDFRIFSFQLSYDQITSVDGSNNQVIIHAGNSQYKCYVSNANEIKNRIFEQRNNKTEKKGVASGQFMSKTGTN